MRLSQELECEPKGEPEGKSNLLIDLHPNPQTYHVLSQVDLQVFELVKKIPSLLIFSAGTIDNSDWSCWSSWTTCTVTCGGPGKRSRERTCVPGIANIGSQDVSCPGTGLELDNSCGYLPCPEPHCPDGYQYSNE